MILQVLPSIFTEHLGCVCDSFRTLRTPSSSSALRATKGTIPAGAACYRRFLHTMKALRQSGLLDITLRTQELMRRSTASERDIAQLSQHTRLLSQLAGQPGAASQVSDGHAPWERLHQAMAQSGGYPSLKAPHREPHSPSRDGDLPVSPSSSPTPPPGPSHGSTRRP